MDSHEKGKFLGGRVLSWEWGDGWGASVAPNTALGGWGAGMVDWNGVGWKGTELGVGGWGAAGKGLLGTNKH